MIRRQPRYRQRRTFRSVTCTHRDEQIGQNVALEIGTSTYTGEMGREKRQQGLRTMLVSSERLVTEHSYEYLPCGRLFRELVKVISKSIETGTEYRVNLAGETMCVILFARDMKGSLYLY